jgi:acyl-CoA synthetase (NDP forming)
MNLATPSVSALCLDRLLRPRSIAVAGASDTPGSFGESVLSNLERARFAGDLHLINPKRSQLRGRVCLSSVDELPQGVDCAVLAIPGSAVVEVVEACARRNVSAAIVFSAGFAESGPEGIAAQQRLAQIARTHSMAIEGPNCLGMVNYVEGVPLTFVGTHFDRRFQSPGVAVLSQSGALAAVLGVNLFHHDLPISYSISTGNEAVCGVEDFVEYLLEDKHTQVVAMIVEQFRQPRRFLELAARARELGKHIVLLHPGSSAAARESAATHTGAMAGDYQTMRVKVAHAGVAVVDTLEELGDVAQLMLRRPMLPRGGAAVFTESGAFKGLTLDLCERLDLNLPAFSEETSAELRRALPAFIQPTNPLDLTAHGLVDPDLYRRTLLPVLADAGVGSVVMTIILTDEATCNLKFPPILSAIRSISPTKPLIFAALDEGAQAPPHYVEELRSLGVPFYPSPERALRAVARLTQFSATEVGCEPVLDKEPLRFQEGAGVIPEYRSKQLLSRWGIPVPAGELARSLEEAGSIAARIGFPVALKAQALELTHKTEAGGVILNIADRDALAEAWHRMHRSVAQSRPNLTLDGALVERMGEPGVELIVGARNDPDWGPVILIGFGGILAEALRDVRLLPPGLSLSAITAELNKLKCSTLLRGFRGSPPLDVEAAARIVSRLGELMIAAPDIREIDINPVVVYPEASGAVALDAVILLNVAQPAHSQSSSTSIGSPT